MGDIIPSLSYYHKKALKEFSLTTEGMKGQEKKARVLVLDTYGGAGHVITANKITKECILSGKTVVRQSVCNDPKSSKKSWVRLCGVDIGKKIIASWNTTQRKGKMGAITNLAWFCIATFIGDLLFSFFAERRMLNCLAKNGGFDEIHDSQHMFAKDFTDAIKKFDHIRNNISANKKYNLRVTWNNLLRKNKFFRLFANPSFKHYIQHEPGKQITYHKHVTETPGGAYNFYVPLFRLNKPTPLKFHSIYAPSLTKKEKDLKNKIEKNLKKSSIITPDIWKSLFNQNKMLTQKVLFEKLGPEKANALWKEYTIAYLRSRCSSLKHLDSKDFIIDSGPIANEFKSKIHATSEERKAFRKNIPILLEAHAFELIKDHQTCLNAAEGSINIPEDCHLSAISLGSQAEVEATVEYVKAKIEMAMANPDKPFFIVPFCGAFKGDLMSAFGQVRELLCQDLPSNLTLLPLTFQSQETISRIFASADELFIRTGGLTTMEVAALAKPSCVVNIHAPGKGLTKKALWKELLPWERGNARYLQAACGASCTTITNPALYKQSIK